MLKAIPAPRDTVGEFAPKMLQIKIPTDKIRDVIGQGGKVIRKCPQECGVKDRCQRGRSRIYQRYFHGRLPQGIPDDRNHCH